MMKLTHVSLIVQDQVEALAFFTEKLGFEKKDDAPMGTDRWLTIGCKGQPLEIILQTPHWGADKASQEEREAQIGKQSFYFATEDAKHTYQMFKDNGVKCLSLPKKQSWGTEFQFEDLYGNVHGMVGPPSK